MTTPTDGMGLEARFQRLFFAQGIFAERELNPSVTGDRRMVATDIDVLVSEYNYGFHPTRLHAECKGGAVRPLDRILWLAGVRKLLGADASYLILPDFNNETATFAWGVDVKLLSLRQLAEWESSLAIPEDVWPARSAYLEIQEAKTRWRALVTANRGDSFWQLIWNAWTFLEINSWLEFSFGRLNRLFRLLGELSNAYPSTDSDRQIAARYIASGLMVRLAQYLLAVCFDVTAINSTDTKNYLYGRLTFGDDNARRSSELVSSTANWIARALTQAGGSLPDSADTARLLAPPAYAETFVELILRLLRQTQSAKHLPIAIECEQFGVGHSTDALPMLAAAVTGGGRLSALLNAFLLRANIVSRDLIKPVGVDLLGRYAVPSPTRQRVARRRPASPLDARSGLQDTGLQRVLTDLDRTPRGETMNEVVAPMDDATNEVPSPGLPASGTSDSEHLQP